MSGVDVATAAHRRDRIKVLLGTIADRTGRLLDLVEEAQRSDDHTVLGYPSWTAYVAAEFADRLARLDRVQRREAVAALTASGMSVRAIADVVGASVGTVHGDQVFNSEHLQRMPRPDQRTGVDGKSYPVPAPAEKSRRAPKRRPLTDQYTEAVGALSKAVERVEQLHRDDRFTSLRQAIAWQDRGELARTAETLVRVLADLDSAGTRGRNDDTEPCDVLPFAGGC